MKITYAEEKDIAAIAAAEAACFPPAEAATEQEFVERIKYYGNHFWLLDVYKRQVQYTVYVITSYTLYIVCAVACRILYLHRKEQIKNNVRTATISFPPGNRQLDSAIQNSYTKDNKRALSTDG